MSKMDQNTIDEVAICRLIHTWGHARDGGDFETLADCFTADAAINISWIHAPASEFVARSKQMAKGRKPGAHQKHAFAGPLIRINDKRAFSICHVNLENRAETDGYFFDLQAWFRFFDLIVKESDGNWRIAKRTAVYEKDRITPVDPRGVPASFFEGMDLSGFATATQYLSWWQASQGRTPRTDIVSVYSQEEKALKLEGERWLS